VDRRRGTARERGYDRKWDVEALAFKRSNPLCLGCKAVGRVTQTEVVDHIIPHRGNHALMWDRVNWQPACAWHHSVVKQQLEAMWVKHSITDRDLRLDSQIAMKINNFN
jgi:5-methylcytosine-specific restriction endonuclease McrA